MWVGEPSWRRREALGRNREGIRRPGAGLREDDEGSDFKVKAKQVGFSN